MAGIGNDLYAPTCATECSDNLLNAVGDTDCPNEASLELSEINELFLDEKSAVFGIPKNPVATYTAWGDNATDLVDWYGDVDNTVASKLRLYYGVGEKPEPNESTITLHKGKTAQAGKPRHTLSFTINLIDQTTYQALLKLQACKGQYHAWFGTDSYIYGGDNGIIVDVEKVTFPKTGGRGDNAKSVIVLSWSASADPIRDPKPW